MTWYSLRDATIPILGERLTTIFAHAISAETDGAQSRVASKAMAWVCCESSASSA
jgi:hypothetical protein